jgi:hypothetical protein
MRSRHQGWAVTHARHADDVFQSSRTSWSSKIIAVGTVDISHRISALDQLSRYSRAYSVKSAAS